MLSLLLAISNAVFLCFLLSAQAATTNSTCTFDAEQKLNGFLSKTEIKFRELGTAFPSIDDKSMMNVKNEVYTMLRNEEFTMPMLQTMLKNKFSSTGPSRSTSFYLLNESFPWQAYFPNKVYSWSLDLHAAPVGCNQAIYRDIGVILHAESNHHPYCKYYGVCSTERLQVFSIQRGEGFSLDPDHNVLKNNFYNHYKTSNEFQRIDTFICSHPAANCEIFEKFLVNSTKSVILFFTTRLEFGRDDMNINWRARVAGRWGAVAEKDMRYKEWLNFMWKYHKSGQLFMTANNVYDQQYAYYMTGIKPMYIPSWCGEYDLSFSSNSWVGCELPADSPNYYPTRNEIIFVPYKQRLWLAHGGENIRGDIDKAMIEAVKMLTNNECGDGNVQEMKVVNCASLKHPIHFGHSANLVSNHAPSAYKKFPAIIMLSYQTSIMTFFEFYRLNIPMFAPSLHFLVQLDLEYKLVNGRIYGWPKRFPDLIEQNTGSKVTPSFPPDPNLNYGSPGYEESARHWLQFSDIYHFPHIILFDNWTHLALLTQTVNLTEVSYQMWNFNKMQRVEIMHKWDHIFRKAVPHRKRGKFHDESFRINHS